MRGRWVCDESLKRYAKATRMQDIINQIPVDVYTFGEDLVANFMEAARLWCDQGRLDPLCQSAFTRGGAPSIER